jgi:hypothetical protein
MITNRPSPTAAGAERTGEEHPPTSPVWLGYAPGGRLSPRLDEMRRGGSTTEGRATGLDRREFSRIGPALAILVDVREDEILSLCKELLDEAFHDSAAKLVIDAMLHVRTTMSLRDIALSCDRGRRAIMPTGELRTALERMESAGMIVNNGTTQKPRYSLDEGDRRVQMLQRMYGQVRLHGQGRKNMPKKET